MTRGSLVVSTPSPSIQVPIVNRYGSQIVYCSPMTHGPFSSLRSISSKHSVIVAGTLRFIASIAAASSAHRAPRLPGACANVLLGKALEDVALPLFFPTFDPGGMHVVIGSIAGTALIWHAPPTGQALVEEIRAILGTRAPEPLNVLDSTSRPEATEP